MGVQQITGFRLEAHTKREIDDRGNVTVDSLIFKPKGDVKINHVGSSEEGESRRRNLRNSNGIRRNRHRLLRDYDSY